GRRGDPVADVDRRADHDDRRRLHGRRDHHRHVHADVQDAVSREVGPTSRPDETPGLLPPSADRRTMSGVNLLLTLWVFALVVLMSAAVIAAFLLPPEDAD